MSAILVAVLALGQPQPPPTVTAAEKQAFLRELAELPTQGEFFTESAVKKMVPKARILLALTRDDLGKRDLYPLFALSAALFDHAEPRRYARVHFGDIAHPTLKLFWAALLVDELKPARAVVTFLRKALASKADAKTLAAITGPGFEQFKQRVNAVAEAGRQTRIELVKRHAINDFPEYKSGSAYTRAQLVFGPDRLLYAVRPLKQRGELLAHDRASGRTTRRPIAQPEGFKPRFDFGDYFDDAAVAVNARGDVLCRWMIEGNGDHGLALLTKGSDRLVVKRVELALADSALVSDPAGAWYLLQWPGRADFTVYALDGQLNLRRLGNIPSTGRHSIGILDARFIAPGVLHLFWADVEGSGNHLRMRCVDFHVASGQWRHNREVFRLDRFVSDAGGPQVLQLPDASLHYLWRVDQANDKDRVTGVYYQAEADGKTAKVTEACEYRAVAVGDCIVVAYTRPKVPNVVFFRTIRRGVPGPETELTVAKDNKYNLSASALVLHAEAGRVWFINAADHWSLYELKPVDQERP